MSISPTQATIRSVDEPDSHTGERIRLCGLSDFHERGALAPWEYAHNAELVEARDPPAECGLEIALRVARDYAATATCEELDSHAVGQVDLNPWSQQR